MTDEFSPEKNVVGCILMGDNEGEIFGELTAGDFQDDTWREVFSKLKVRWELSGHVEPEIIANYPETHREYAVFAMNTLPALSGWKLYASQVKEGKALARAQTIGLQVATNGMDLEDIQAKANELMQVVNYTTSAESLDMADGVAQFLREKQTPREYIKTGFSLLDHHTFIDRGDYVVIGGRPSSGKTAFSLVLTLALAKAGKRICYFSLETSPKKIMDRLITSHCGLDFSKVKRQQLGDEWEKVEHLDDDLTHLPIEIIKAAGKTVAWIQAEAVRRRADIVMIDYIGLIKSEGRDRYEKMTNTSMDIHNFAQQTGITVFALSQLNRNSAGKPPNMEDIRESGQIEQDADVILLLHNTLKIDAFKKKTGEYVVFIAKNKEGAGGDIPMDFDGEHQRFCEVEQRYGA